MRPPYYIRYSVLYQPTAGAVSATGWTQQQQGREGSCEHCALHYFHTQTSTVEYVCPSVKDVSLVVLDGLVEVETVQVECHGANTSA